MLTPRADGLWTVDHALVVGGLPMGTRTTVFRLGDGRLLVHAPGELAPADAEAIRALGQVAAVVAPNLLHHLFYARALEAFPEAQGWVAPGLAAKLRGARIDGSLDEAAKAPWQGSLQTCFVEGMPAVAETAFFQPSTRTLVVTDLAFNLVEVEGWFGRSMLRMVGAYGPLGPSFLAKNVYMKDKAAVRRSIAPLFDWDFDRVVVAHGSVRESGGHAQLKAAYDAI